ncbi:MAG: protein kinase [Deltaproteobacteria bacterium]|nr:MAG: protein kinase [Deltaproteobacteria bacterium]
MVQYEDGSEKLLVKKTYGSAGPHDFNLFLRGFANTLRFANDSNLAQATMQVVSAEIDDNEHLVVYLEAAEDSNLAERKDLILPAEKSDTYEKWALEFMEEVLRPLSLAHTHGIAHRDIKSQNFVYLNGKIRLIDFDHARRTGEPYIKNIQNRPVGTYFPPEILAQEDPHFKVDIYAVGVTLYEVLTQDPHVGRGFVKDIFKKFPPLDQLVKKEKKEHFINPEKLQNLPDSVQEIIRQATQHDPEKRYSNAGMMIKDIHSALKKLQLFDTQEMENTVSALGK